MKNVLVLTGAGQIGLAIVRSIGSGMKIVVSDKSAANAASAALLLNNAGFDVLSDSSLYPYYSVYSIQIVFIILLIIGGIGYPVIYETVQFIVHKAKGRTDFKFSLFTKVSSITYLLVFIFGLVFTLTFEIGNKSLANANINLQGI